MELAKMTDAELERISATMKAIAHPARLRILCHLKDGPRSVSALEKTLGMDQPLVSQQLRILRLNGLVQTRRGNGFVFYSLHTAKKKHLEKIMAGLCQC
jgi:DNA-binding transcriptional ArsR family regulator